MTTTFCVFKRTPIKGGYQTEYIRDFNRLSTAVAYCEYESETMGIDYSNWDTDENETPIMIRLGNLGEIHLGIDIVTDA